MKEQSEQNVNDNVNVNSARAAAKPKPPPPQPSATLATNVNLSDPEKELLRWHQRLGHIGMKKVQWLMRQGILGLSQRAQRLCQCASALTQAPLCTACQYAKQWRKPKPGNVQHARPNSKNMLKTGDLYPGSRISVDHFEANPCGQLLHTYG